MKCQDTIEKFGGHSMAIGITIKRENFQKFCYEFEEVAKDSNLKDIFPMIQIDAEFELKDINKDMVKSLEQLEPFGEGNKTPIFVFRNVKIDSIRALSEGKHLKLTLKDGNIVVDAIGFNLGHLAEEYRIGDRIDVVGILEISTFNGLERIQINLKDVIKSI